MLRISPVCYAPSYAPCWASDRADLPPARWQAAEPPPWAYEAVENQDALTDLDYTWFSGDKPPLENLSSALTIQNALLQRQLLLQAGVGNEHVGILVRFQVYSAKGASLPAVMPAVWATPEFAERVQRKHEELKAPFVGGHGAGVDLTA
ncbi:MAG TPA: hypothetical protein VMV10_16840 [Pirellulales bacterium]|nr:hypothetical protein [Pirellulales bacterium]